jgi:hypothetical protein
MRQRAALVVTAAAVLASATWADPVKVTVRVHDAKARPAAGAEVATMWEMKGGIPVPAEGAAHAKVRGGGLASITLEKPNGPVLLSAYDADRENAGLAVLTPSSTELEIQLRPVAKITQSLKLRDECRAVGSPPWAIAAAP